MATGSPALSLAPALGTQSCAMLIRQHSAPPELILSGVPSLRLASSADSEKTS